MRRRWLSPRALLLHLALLVWVAGCLLAGWWQVHRALSGNTLSYVYSIEWPAFALAGIYAWWLLVHVGGSTPGRTPKEQLHAARRAASGSVARHRMPAVHGSDIGDLLVAERERADEARGTVNAQVTAS
ncbi:MAG: hypothetical protein ACRDWE_04240, partial [Acidimicrobiales bacterium]